MDLNLVRELISMMENSKLSSMEIELNDMRIKMGKNSGEHSAEDKPAKKMVEEYKYEAVTSSEAPMTKIDTIPKVEMNLADCLFIKAPMVGTFYSSPSPDSEAFVCVGKNIKKGETVCIIEAMKLMNEIESEDSGEVLEVLVKHGDMVEYGQPLFKIKK